MSLGTVKHVFLERTYCDTYQVWTLWNIEVSSERVLLYFRNHNTDVPFIKLRCIIFIYCIFHHLGLIL